jgi:hypothetical protein
MTKTAAKPLSKPAGKSSSKLGWVLGWVVVPGLIVAALFLAGVHVGARHPDIGLSRAILWVTGGEAQLGPTSAAERQPLAQRLRRAALPSVNTSIEAELSKADLDALVARGAGQSIAELDCAAACEIRWTAKHPDREFISVERCELTPPTLFSSATIECEAKVQR